MEIVAPRPFIAGSVAGTAAGTAFRMSSAAWLVVVLAAVVRLALFPFADNKQADAPIRTLLAERMNGNPAAAADPRSFRQLGPLPIEVMRPFLALAGDTRRASRFPSLLAGVLAFLPFFALARRFGVGAQAELLAGLALALAPLHIQVSTTAASEALYLLLLLAMLERLHAALSSRRHLDFLLAGLLGSLAAVTRYDMWLSLPFAGAAALFYGPRDRRALADVALFLTAAALLPLAYLGWSLKTAGDPFFFFHYITKDHANLAAATAGRMGPVAARIRQIGVWAISFAAAMTPLPFAGLSGMRRTWRAASAATRVVLVTVLAPIGVYLFQGLVFGEFEPLPRFAIAPGAVLLPLAAATVVAWWGRRTRGALTALLVTLALALSGITELLAFARPGRSWSGAECLGPLTRIDAEDRALAAYLRANRRPEEGVFIDPLGFTDIVIIQEAGIPIAKAATLASTRTPSATLAETRARTAASWFAAHDWAWGGTVIPDWPSDGLRFGGWRLAHYWPGRIVYVPRRPPAPPAGR
ncbi:MAG TPA: glycosyltransferase family 39 protein [Polyangia bacterium]